MLDRRSQAIYDKPFLGRKEVNGRKRARDPEGIAFKVGDSREQGGGRVVRRQDEANAGAACQRIGLFVLNFRIFFLDLVVPIELKSIESLFR